MKKKVTIERIQHDIVQKALPHVPFDGWTETVFNRAVAETEYSSDLVQVAFPRRVQDLIFAFARFIDKETASALAKGSIQDMRVRDRIKIGVQTRLKVLASYREAERLAVGFYVLPIHTRHGLKSVWQTADLIWDFAGDTATDYNRYTKRALLSSVLVKVTLFWLQDESDAYQETDAFLDRQIDRVLTVGKTVARVKSFF